MSEFNITGWLKNHYLAEAGEPSSKVTSLVPLIVDAINQVDENLSYKDLAEAIGIILIEQYGSHNFQPFMGVLHSKIGIGENILKESLDLNDIAITHTAELEKIFDSRPYVSMGPYGEGSLTFNIKDELSDEDWKKALTWVKDQGYQIETQSNYYEVDIDDDRSWFPKIKFSFPTPN